MKYYLYCKIYKNTKLNTNICIIMDFEYILTYTKDGGIELTPEKKMTTVKTTTPSVPLVVVEPKISHELQNLFDTIPHSIPELIKIYASLTSFEKLELVANLENNPNCNILEFYVNDIYFGYFYGIKFALSALSKHECGIEIINKIKNGIVLSDEEENIIDFGGHSGCSFQGLINLLEVIFTTTKGDNFNNYHLVFDKGEFQRRHYLFLD